jgi:hypothetical protein
VDDGRSPPCSSFGSFWKTPFIILEILNYQIVFAPFGSPFLFILQIESINVVRLNLLLLNFLFHSFPWAKSSCCRRWHRIFIHACRLWLGLWDNNNLSLLNKKKKKRRRKENVRATVVRYFLPRQMGLYALMYYLMISYLCHKPFSLANLMDHVYCLLNICS